MQRNLVVLLVTTMFALAGGPLAAEDRLERRGGAEPVTGRVVEITDAGVVMEVTPGRERTFAWDEVRALESEGHASAFAERREMAEMLWRARSRLQRGDWMLAEAPFDRLFERFRGQSHETALIISEGLLRCRLARQANHEAIVPMLEVVRLRRAGLTTDRYDELGPVIDDRTQLAPALPPIWLETARLDRLRADLDRYDAHGDPVVAAMAALYRHSTEPISNDRSALAAPASAGRQGERNAWPDHAGLALLRAMVSAFDPESSAREEARRRLREFAAADTTWVEAWARSAAGLSLVGEDGRGRQQRGLVQLIHLPARFAATQPYLAGIALAQIDESLARLGSDVPESLREEMQRRFPHHPARDGGMVLRPGVFTPAGADDLSNHDENERNNTPQGHDQS